MYVDADWVFSRIRPRNPEGHKGVFGRLLMVVGSDDYRGAALLCAGGALHAGVGYAVLAASEKVCAAMAVAYPEAVLCPIPQDREPRRERLLRELDLCDALLLGNGLGQSEGALETVSCLLSHCRKPLLVDADGINLLALHKLEWNTPIPPVLTPHKGELGRLLGLPREAVARDALTPAAQYARAHKCVLVCKDAKTVTLTPEGGRYVNTTGNAGLAKAGSGDVLAGIIGSLLAQGLAPAEAAVCGVWLHGAAADVAAARSSQHGMRPSDVCRSLGQVFLAHLGQ